MVKKSTSKVQSMILLYVRIVHATDVRIRGDIPQITGFYNMNARSNTRLLLLFAISQREIRGHCHVNALGDQAFADVTTHLIAFVETVELGQLI